MTQSLNLVPNQTTNGQGNQISQRGTPKKLRGSDQESVRAKAEARLRDDLQSNEKEFEGLSVQVKIDRGGDGSNFLLIH